MAVPTFEPSVQKTALLVQNLLDLEKETKLIKKKNGDGSSISGLPSELGLLVSNFMDAQKKFTSGIEDFMHRDDWKEDELESTRVIAETCPEILEVPQVIEIFDHEIIHHILPIHCAAESFTTEIVVEYVPLLAKIGLGNRVGGEEGRGGLLVHSSPSNRSSVIVALMKNDDLQTIKALIEKDLLFQNDMCSDGPEEWFGLLHDAALHGSLETVKLFVEFNRAALQKFCGGSNALSLSNSKDIATYLLQQTLQYYPMHETIGGLFPLKANNSNDDSTVPLIKLIENFGEDDAWDVIEESFSSLKEVPILHKVVEHAPDQILNTIKRFPESVFCRDDQNRLPIHVALEGGLQWSDELVNIMNANMSHLKDQDPVTGFYPFALAASEPCCDLKTIIFLLKLHPAQGQNSYARRVIPLSNDDGDGEREHKRRKIDESTMEQ